MLTARTDPSHATNGTHRRRRALAASYDPVVSSWQEALVEVRDGYAADTVAVRADTVVRLRFQH